MAQNTSSAVMQQRSEPHDSLDDFPTPPWGTRALLKHVIGGTLARPDHTVWEPSCNRGFMTGPLREYFRVVHASDIFDYWPDGPHPDWLQDFLLGWADPGCIRDMGVDWVIANPPFRLAHGFIDRARGLARAGVAMLVRTSFLEGVNRYESLFKPSPPTIVAQFAERLPMVKGRCDPKASTATSYCWLVWVKGHAPLHMMWIPPCRKALERAGDYDPLEELP